MHSHAYPCKENGARGDNTHIVIHNPTGNLNRPGSLSYVLREYIGTFLRCNIRIFSWY